MLNFHKQTYFKMFIVAIFKIFTILHCCKANEIGDFFRVYWNAPTMQCHSHKIYFNLSEKFQIIQNQDDTFRGDRISILYDPGYFPALLQNRTSKSLFYRNGGIPQNGNLSEHLSIFYDQLEKLIPDPDNDGLAIIDFESWRPIFRQNFGTLQPYQDVSFRAERSRHPFWSNKSIWTLAEYAFEHGARTFMQSTINLAKQMRPNAFWGYYAYPYCFNMNSQKRTNCAAIVPGENNKTLWLFENSDVFYPSLYFSELYLNGNQRQQLIKGRIAEAQRIARLTNGPRRRIIPYFWYKYRDTGNFVTKEDLYRSFTQLKTSGTDGVIIWGSSNDVNTKTKCQNVYDYVFNVLGPIVNEVLES